MFFAILNRPSETGQVLSFPYTLIHDLEWYQVYEAVLLFHDEMNIGKCYGYMTTELVVLHMQNFNINIKRVFFSEIRAL